VTGAFVVDSVAGSYNLCIMRSLILGFVLLVTASAFAAGPLITTCTPKNPREVNLIRVTTAEARQMLVRKTEISTSTTLSAKFASQEVTLEVDVDREGNIECFMLMPDRVEEKFTDDDKEELRGALATGLNFWIFRPYAVNGQPAEVRASYRLQVEPRRLVLTKPPTLRPKF
jgi:hypothetical protein